MTRARALAVLFAAATLAAGAHAQTKKELVQKILAIQQPGIEALAQQLAEEPAARLMQQAGAALQRVPADKREALGRDIQADVRKYADEAVPLVRDRAVQLAPGTIGALLEEKFTEDELKQVVVLLESPVNRKFQQLAGDMQKALVEKLVADTRPTIEPKVRALEAGLAKRLGIPPQGSATGPTGGGPRNPAPAASGPRK